MRPNALKENTTLTPLETPEFLLSLEELGVEAGVEEVEVPVGMGIEEVRVTPCCIELDRMWRTKSRVSTHHRATHRDGGSNGLFKVVAGAALLETGSGLLDKLVIAAQAGSIIDIA